MEIISLKNMTKKYNPNIGCFNINIAVKKGEVYGFLGPNGAGKTTVIRQMVGFIKSDNGTGTILGYDVWKDTKNIMKDLGYLAGEVNLPEYMTGISYLKTISEIRGNVDWKYVEKLIEYFDFDPKQKIKKMSKGMKQKVAIISAFMHKPKVLILDEPTSGLDPLMQQKFDTLIKNLQKEEATIFMSSHIFSEIDNTCDKVAIIKKR
ncbi:ABC transporter ATP-binding protein [Spiroplasma citri]|uniref:ABC transporter ATP-binding protein n=1 Tax=Spiroplasma citri TaxID=2133 RepID=UPI0020A3A0FA|nr:ABC transporter ATP-binding protein [Spiroplasma citri]